MAELSVEQKADLYDKLFAEIRGTLGYSLDKMRDVAAEGKGTEHESKTNPIYNRYFGCAIAMDSLLKGFFKELMPEIEEEPETEAKADAPAN